MQINSIIDIVDGVLLNSPSISFIYNIKNDAKRVIEGDLFISSNQEEIPQAIENGAFAIIVDENTIITDNEIAWIKVKSIEDALIRLFRFKLAAVDLKAYYCDTVTYDLLQVYKSQNKNLKFITEPIENSVKVIEQLHQDDVIICNNSNLLDKIAPSNRNFTYDYEIENLTAHSMFETSFSCNDEYFSKLKIPSLYIKQFFDVYEFFNKELDDSKLKRFTHLKPIFIDKFSTILEFGKSNKFILVQKNLNLVEEEIAYINEHYKYATTLYVSKYKVDHLDMDVQIMPNLDELKDFLKNNKFNCLYIMGYEYDEIEYILSQSTHQLTLL